MPKKVYVTKDGGKIIREQGKRTFINPDEDLEDYYTEE